MNSQQHGSLIELSIVSPARNEEQSISRFIDQVGDGFGSSNIAFELIIVDDGSSDLTPDIATSALQSRGWLRVLRIDRDPADRGCGKSAALLCGIEAAAGDYVALIDADGQNDPRDLIRMLQALKQSQFDMVHGDRSGRRRDNWGRRLSSVGARWLRQLVLRDGIRDSACGLSIMSRHLARALPLQFGGIHRFLPSYAKIAGYTVLQLPISHHPRTAGKSKYGFGNRAVRCVTDILALLWMSRRYRMASCKEVRRARDSIASGQIESICEQQANPKL